MKVGECRHAHGGPKDKDIYSKEWTGTVAPCDALAIAIVADARAVAIVRTLRNYAFLLKHAAAVHADGTRSANTPPSLADTVS